MILSIQYLIRDCTLESNIWFRGLNLRHENWWILMKPQHWKSAIFIQYCCNSYSWYSYSVYTIDATLSWLTLVAIDAGKRMGVDPILSASELSDPSVDHLSVMTYLNRFRYATPVKSDNEKLSIQGDFDNHLTGVQVLIQTSLQAWSTLYFVQLFFLGI